MMGRVGRRETKKQLDAQKRKINDAVSEEKRINKLKKNEKEEELIRNDENEFLAEVPDHLEPNNND